MKEPSGFIGAAVSREKALFYFFVGKENVLLVSFELPPKALQCVRDIEHK